MRDDISRKPLWERGGAAENWRAGQRLEAGKKSSPEASHDELQPGVLHELTQSRGLWLAFRNPIE